MPSVVFLRAVNVGGHQTFQPSKLAKALSHLDVVNVGAAGTFVIRNSITRAALRTEFAKHLPFDPEMMICSAKDVLVLVQEKAFHQPVTKDSALRRFVTVLAKRPGKLPKLPLMQPTGDQWEVKVLRVSGCFALSWHRRQGPRGIYPNEVVEKHFGLPATTRNWNTIEAICDILNGTA
jgi:uncharacterized protein (DUF1697 family)